MSWLTTHVLDTTRGTPAAGVVIVCEAHNNGTFTEVGRGTTDADGRLKTLFPVGEPVKTGTYRLTFETGGYYAAMRVQTFYPRIQILFEVADEKHYHVPLLMSPFGYTTYRGS